MAKFNDKQVEELINLWHSEPSLWKTSSAAFSNADERKAALNRISGAMDHGLDIGKFVQLYFWPSYGRTLSDASMLYFADVFYRFFMAALVGQTAERIFTKLSHMVDISCYLRTY